MRESMVFDHRVGGGEGGSPKTKSLFRPVFVVLILPFSVQIFKMLSIKTIVRVRGGEGPQSMVKDPTFALLNFGTHLLPNLTPVKWPIFLCLGLPVGLHIV